MHPEQLLQAWYRQLQQFVAVRPDGTLPAVSDLVRPCIGGSDLGEIGGSVQLEWLSDLGEIGSKHVETARASEGSGGGWLAFHMSEFIESIRVSGGSGGGGPVGHVRSLIDNIRPSGGGGGGSGYVTSTVSQQNVLFEQFPLLLIPGV